MERVELPGGKWGALAGIAFAVLLFMTVAVIDAPRSATDEAVSTWWADSANQTSAIVSMYCALGASLAFLVFLTQLCTRLRAAEGGHAPVTSLVHACGLVFTVLLLIAGLARGAVSAGVRFGDEPLPGVDVLRLVPEISFVALGPFGLITMAVAIAGVSALILRTGVHGRWLAWLGFAVATSLLGSVVIGAFLLPVLLLWTLAISVAMFRSGSRALVQATAAVAS